MVTPVESPAAAPRVGLLFANLGAFLSSVGPITGFGANA